ncbi:MAG: DNA polymerase III subunit gamma/tau [Candidatus Doudnabacteria bacterium]|nr:DNA polymerase III subunit gamma/tau [Candidatus Doudnabacteria bacterium]
MAVLYRKYRPQIFKEVVGQSTIIKTLQNQVNAGQVAHAYLFVGSRGVGKTSVARILAKAVNCKKSIKYQVSSIKESPHPNSPRRGEGSFAGDACGECDVCRSIQNGNFVDLVEIDAASNTGVDNVRELIEHVRFSPAVGRYKVFIIDEVHMLSKGAFNALLKTLEEPPKHAVFILATTEIGKVPATIISRTQRFDFKRLSVMEIEAQLLDIIKKEQAELPIEGVKLIAEHAEGGLRDALSLLDKVFTLGSKPSLEEILQLVGITDSALLGGFLGFIAGSKPVEIPPFIDRLLQTGADFRVFNKDFLEYLRKVLILKITGQNNNLNLPEEHFVITQKLASQLSENEIIHITRLFLRSLKEQSLAPSAELPILLAGVEASLRKNVSNAWNQQTALNQQPVKSVFASTPPKIEVSDSTLKSIESPEVLVSAVESSPTAVIRISQEEVAAEWPSVIEKLKNINGPLAQLLKSSPLNRVAGGRIIVGVKYKFHKQNLEHPKNQETICKILEEIYKQRLVVSGEVRLQQEPEKAPQGAIADALKVFGGELVE